MTVPLRRYTPSRYAGSTPLTVTSASSTSCSTGAKLPAKALFVEWAWTHAGVFCSGLSVSVAVSTAGAVLTARSTRRRGSRATATPTLHQGTPVSISSGFVPLAEPSCAAIVEMGVSVRPIRDTSPSGDFRREWTRSRRCWSTPPHKKVAVIPCRGGCDSCTPDTRVSMPSGRRIAPVPHSVTGEGASRAVAHRREGAAQAWRPRRAPATLEDRPTDERLIAWNIWSRVAVWDNIG
jgi:hypothetical protein